MKKLPRGFVLRNGEPVAEQDLYSAEQARKLKLHVDRASLLLKSVPDEYLVTVAKAMVRLSGEFVEEGLNALQNSQTARRYAIGEIAVAAYPDIVTPSVYKGETASAALARAKEMKSKGGAA